MGRKASLSGRKPGSVKPERARKIIRSFHVLLKAQAHARVSGDVAELERIEEEISKLGGLELYQRASISGQSKRRGGDSSKLLVEWVCEDKALSLLEVGCLQVDNACARSKQFDPHVRIDLNSQSPAILKQDFMKMKLTRKFDVISLSLVVNFVPDAVERGKMMARANKFLNDCGLLFFVLPRACVDNSRYCNTEIISELFQKVGFDIQNEKKTDKLVYWLLRKAREPRGTLPKRKVRDGATMNNFAIILV